MIGVFDSGVGGVTVWRALRARLPGVPMAYFADQAHVPYGPRPEAEVRALSERAARLLIARGARVIVVACNTATAVALDHLRSALPEIGWVGIEPAIKPAAQRTRGGVIAVAATAATLRSARYAALCERHAAHLRVVEAACPEWVTLAERGNLDAPDARALVARRLDPLLDAGVDVLVLGCTHFPLLNGLIESVARARGAQLAVLDPAPAVAEQAARVWGARAATPAPDQVFSSAPNAVLRALFNGHEICAAP